MPAAANSNLFRQLGLKHPLIVAPMAGGPSSVELAAAASAAGALGAMGGAYSNAAAIEAFADQVRQRTDKPFSINLFIPHSIADVAADRLERAVAATARYRQELELPSPQLEAPYEEDFDAQFEAVLRVKPACFSFVFGLLSADHVHEAKKAGIPLIGTATTLDEARALEESGVDAIVLQGFEAGGHRGIFDAGAADPEIGMHDLLAQCAGTIRVPLIAAGGIMTSSDIRAALQAGAQAVQMGTAFLACAEAGTSAPYRRKLLETSERWTRTTRAFSGRFARGIENRFMDEMDGKPDAILPFPAQNKFTRDMRGASTAKGLPDFLSLWSGTGNGELWQGSTAALIDRLFPE
ncbi:MULTISPECIES: nitronate monooxygenase [unclassified Rhizobium]|uniref:NAD(P)H-dependent flavin oxidoreductase n=1 Tax=unclassified Rhizobium TaxID=2613769 RepID=UPI000EA87FBD|nr:MULTISPECIES: nitronate monooxygenase [unclassified Rhizobium]AYG67273.1 nitronate monooxygenase [Rhizobium sp. CCGE531]AYG73667.1 nitronate monooxygenase [Rhizobium sp. CCGE532]